MQIDIINSEINLVLEELFNFIRQDEIIKPDFEEYSKTMGGANNFDSFAQLAIPYIFERNLPDINMSVIELYLQKHQTLPQEALNLLEALNVSKTSIYEIKRNLKNGFKVLNLINEKIYDIIYPFKMTNLRGIGAGQFIVARIFQFEGEYYIMEITGILPSNKKTEAMQYAVTKIIENPQLVYLDNPEKEQEISLNVKTLYSKFKEAFGTDILFTTSTNSDEIISIFNEYTENGTLVDLEGKLEELNEYKYFEVKDYNTNYNSFIKNSVQGYFNKKEVYDVAILFDEDEGLYVIPFYKSLERILTSDEFDKIENYDKCVKFFLTTPSISGKILKRIYAQYPRFTDIVNYVLKDNLSFDEILKKFKRDNEKMFSHTTILYNSNVFSSTLNNIVETSKTENIDYTGAKRNEPCPCGSGKKYKHCCGK